MWWDGDHTRNEEDRLRWEIKKLKGKNLNQHQIAGRFNRMNKK